MPPVRLIPDKLNHPDRGACSAEAANTPVKSNKLAYCCAIEKLPLIDPEEGLTLGVLVTLLSDPTIVADTAGVVAGIVDIPRSPTPVPVKLVTVDVSVSEINDPDSEPDKLSYMIVSLAVPLSVET